PLLALTAGWQCLVPCRLSGTKRTPRSLVRAVPTWNGGRSDAAQVSFRARPKARSPGQRPRNQVRGSGLAVLGPGIVHGSFWSGGRGGFGRGAKTSWRGFHGPKTLSQKPSHQIHRHEAMESVCYAVLVVRRASWADSSTAPRSEDRSNARCSVRKPPPTRCPRSQAP